MKKTVSGVLALLLTAVLLVSPVFAANDLISDIPVYDGNYVWMGMEGSSPIKWHIIGETGYEYLLFSTAMSKAGLSGQNAAQGIAQPEAVISAVRVFYNWLPMVLSIILFVAFVSTFRLERDLKRLRRERDEP